MDIEHFGQNLFSRPPIVEPWLSSGISPDPYFMQEKLWLPRSGNGLWVHVCFSGACMMGLSHRCSVPSLSKAPCPRLVYTTARKCADFFSWSLSV